MTGKTGHIQFDKNGNRIKPEYDILNLHSSSMGKKEWKRISYWNTNENRLIPNGVSMKWLGGKIIHPTNSLNMKEVRVITALTEPFAFYGSRDEDVKDGKVVCALGFPCKTLKSLGNGTSSFQTKCCKGLAMDLLRMLESDLGFKADLHVVKDGKYGGFNRQTRSWNGLIGELLRGEADMAVADLTITDSRSQVVDFTQPYLHVGLGILVSVEKDRQAWLLRFLDPFSIEMWIVTIATINIVFVLLWFLDKNSPGGHYRKGGNYKEKKKFHLIASLWFTWGSVFRTDECESRPRSYSSRALAVVFAFGMLVITNTYTANLAAVLVSENEANSISGIQDPKLQNPTNGFTIGTVKETSMEKVFKESTDPVYSQIWKKMKLNQVNTFAEGVQKVYNGELSAFIGDEPTLLYHISKQKTCKLKLVGKPFFQSGFGIALTKNSSFTNKLSDILILYQKLDTYRKLTQRWLSGTCNNNAKPGSNFKEMTIDDLGGAYVIVLIGVFTSVVVLSFEFYVDKFGFPFSHIWTNKPHRHFPSTRELFKKGIIRNKRSQWFSTAPLELSISHRRFIESMHKSSLNYGASYEEKVEPGPNEDVIFRTDYSASTYTEYNSSASLSCPASPVSITFGTSLRDCKMNRTL